MIHRTRLPNRKQRSLRLRQWLWAWLGVWLCCGLHAATEVPALEYRITGLDSVAERNLRLHLGTLEPGLIREPERLHRAVRRAVNAALPPFGWYEAEFELAIEKKKLRIDVSPGPRIVYLTPTIRVDGPAATLPDIASRLGKAPFVAGRPLSHRDYDQFRDELLRTCHRLGFFRARYVSKELRIDRTRHQAEVALIVESGPRFHFAGIEISGTRVDRQRFEGLAKFKPGDTFDRDKLQRFERRLRDTGYFQNLAVTLRREDPDLAHVMVLAEDVKTSRYDVGAGFSTDSDLRLRFDRVSPLLNDRGDSLTIQSEFSAPRQTLEATLRIPHHDPLDDIFEVTAGLQGKRVEDTDTVNATLGIRHTMKVFGEWSYSYGISAELEKYTIGDASNKDAGYLLPATSISRTKLDPGIDPRHGYNIWTSFDFSDTRIGSAADFLRWRGGAKWLTALADDNTTLLARVDGGAIWTDGFNQTPASLRFHTGGDSSIRGYDFESLGPRDADGNLIGGRYLSVGSLELSRRVRPTLRVAVFADGGSAFTEQHDNFYQSAGVGLRWLSPIGQIRADLAMPVHDRENAGVKLHISMGPPL